MYTIKLVLIHNPFRKQRKDWFVISIYHFIAKCLFLSFLYFYLLVCLEEEYFHGQESHLPKSVNDVFTCVESQVNVFVYKTRSVLAAVQDELR